MVRLGLAGEVSRVEVDTRFFKGNSPGWVGLDFAVGDGDWKEVLTRVAVEPDTVNSIDLPSAVTADRVRLSIHPDGGVARLRVWGRPSPGVAALARVAYLNSLFDQEARRFFETACRSHGWIEGMLARRPFADSGAVLAAAEAVFDGLGEDDWLEAFAAHPRIGERRGSQGPEGERMSESEQAGVEGKASAELAAVNREYETRFGFTYIVRAAGRDGAEMVALARERLGHDRRTELVVAAGEQREITGLRLRRLLCLAEEEG